MPLADAPDPAADVSSAVVVADEWSVILGYRVTGKAPRISSELPKVWTGEEPDTFAVIEITALVHRFGYPNDEALDGHPLHDAGIQYYSAAEVLGSPWPRELEVQNRVHPGHSPRMYEGLRHLIFTFHDTTFECVCSGFIVRSYEGPLEGLLTYMASLLKSRQY